MSMRLAALEKQRDNAIAKISSILATAGGNQKPLTDREQKDIVSLRADLDDINPVIASIRANNTITPEMALFGGDKREQHETPGSAHEAKHNAKRLLEDLSAFYRGQEITASDSPLLIGSGGLSGTVPTFVLDALPTYFNLDSFALAGATIYPTDNTDPLVKPIISAGVSPDAFSEGASATDSHPMQVDTFVFHGQKYSRLVKASEEALMNTALDLPSEITGELTAAVANGFTSVITAAMVTALQANPDTLVDSGINDPYYSAVALIDAVPPRFANPSNCFMGSRAMRTLLRNARASGSGQPLLNPVDDTILGHRFVINDNLTRLVYGNFSAGVFVRKSPFFLQILLELFSSSGERGFKATQWLDQHFLAEKTTVAAQPLYYTHLDASGS